MEIERTAFVDFVEKEKVRSMFEEKNKKKPATLHLISICTEIMFSKSGLLRERVTCNID